MQDYRGRHTELRFESGVPVFYEGAVRVSPAAPDYLRDKVECAGRARDAKMEPVCEAGVQGA